MLFNSIQFLIFLPIVSGRYWFVFNRNLWWQNLFIIVVSYIFCGWWDWRFLILIAFTSLWAWDFGEPTRDSVAFLAYVSSFPQLMKANRIGEEPVAAIPETAYY